jgi:hypothetical protein
MLRAPVIKRKPMRSQMYFDFIQAEDAPKKNSTASRRKKPGPSSPKKGFTAPLPCAQNTDLEDDTRVVAELCLLLYNLARKHVSPASFADFCSLARCTKVLQDLGLRVEVSPEMQAHVADATSVLVTSAPEYRLLRSRAIAGLATVADLITKLPAKGSADYQRGMRDAYQQASDTAALFLEELEQFQFLRRPR